MILHLLEGRRKSWERSDGTPLYSERLQKQEQNTKVNISVYGTW